MINLPLNAIKSVEGKGVIEDKPIYIVDGQAINPLYNPIIESLNRKEIKKRKTYRGKKAIGVFGEIAEHGCVVITTKKGNYRVENDESYAALSENPFKAVGYDPLSTFSVDVDRASYSNVRRMINNGQDVPIDAVKIEEMINYFDYGYDAPKNEQPIAIHTEVASSPWNSETRLVKIGLKGKALNDDQLPPSNLVFLIDVSGSMNNSNKLPLLKSAFKVLVGKLRKKDKVSIVVYAGAAGVVLESTPGDQKEKILSAINNLNAGGSTAGGQGIQLAYEIAKQEFIKSGNNRVILATDGDFNVGMSSDKAMKDLIKEQRKSRVFLTCLGFGMGNYKDSKLETLADTGNGNHAYIDTMQEAHKFLGKEFRGTLYTIAKDVKIQVEFNPQLVKAYRLIGYENRLLANEDFVDDTKDAGEIGSGHTVTALYEVVLVNSRFDPVKNDELKYTQTNTNNYGDELLTVKFRYKKPSEDISKELSSVVLNSDLTIQEASSDFKFTSAVALFGMQLRKSKHALKTSKDDVIALAQSGRGADNDGFKAEFIRLVKSH